MPQTIIFTEEQWKEFDKLCALFCTKGEIADWFGISEDTVERLTEREKGMGFREYWTKMSARGRASLRRKQFEKALEGDNTMLIWMGKQHLGQSEKHVNLNLNTGGGGGAQDAIDVEQVRQAIAKDPALKLLAGGGGE